MRLLFLLILACSLAEAGAVKVATYPVRHPVKTVKSGGHAVFYPVIHPKRTAHAVWKVVW